MKATLTLLALILPFIACLAQPKYNPQILILAPYKVTYDKSLEQEIAGYNKQIDSNRKQITARITGDDLGEQPENIMQILQHEKTFIKTLDFSKQASLITEQFFLLYLVNNTPDFLVAVKDMKCNGDLPELKKVAEKNQFRYVINFPRIEFYKEDGSSKAKISFQLYDHDTKTVIIDKDYTGDWKNRGGMFMCQDSTLSCTINNALSNALEEVIEIFIGVTESSMDDYEDEMALSGKRYDVLIHEYYPKPMDAALVKAAIPATDTTIDLKLLYHAVTDDTKTKFIAFFSTPADSVTFRAMIASGKHHNSQMVSSTGLKDVAAAGYSPKTFAYTVKGVKYNGKWHYQKSDITHFHALSTELARKSFYSNLQDKGFFKERTAEVNPLFWETGEFSKVEDITKRTEWEKAGATIWATEERENRDYVGMYEFMAQELKKQAQADKKAYDSVMRQTVFVPFYRQQAKNNPEVFTDTTFYKRLVLIYPKERDMILSPVLLTDKQGEVTLRYYFVFTNAKTVYEWTYFLQTPVPPNASPRYQRDVMDQLATITQWNYLFATLDDKNFWNKYVLFKENGNYKYLKPVL